MNSTALITGASKGLGLELAKVFASRSYDLVLVARSESLLKSIQSDLIQRFGIRVEILVQDLSLPEGPKQTYSFVEKLGLEIEVLVNNAGFGEYGPAWEIPFEREEEMVQLNIQALIKLTRLFLPGMLERKRGSILNMASMAGFLSGPGMAVYFATKAFVVCYSEAVAMELQGTGVTVTAYCPGPIRTGFEKTANLEGTRLFWLIPVAEAKPVAHRAYQALKKKKILAIDGLLNETLVFSMRLCPRWLVRLVMVYILGKR